MKSRLFVYGWWVVLGASMLLIAGLVPDKPRAIILTAWFIVYGALSLLIVRWCKRRPKREGETQQREGGVRTCRDP